MRACVRMSMKVCMCVIVGRSHGAEDVAVTLEW